VPSDAWNWVKNRYRKRIKGRKDLCDSYKTKSGEKKLITLFEMSDLPIRYHAKIRAEANPFDPTYQEYFDRRDKRNKMLAMRDRKHMRANSHDKLAA